MIDHNKHYDRYSSLMELVSSGAASRRKDGGYMAAFYILSADTELFRMTCLHTNDSGIDFQKLLSTARRKEVSTCQLTAIKVAHNLFNDGSGSTTPKDLTQCDYETLDIIIDAIYIWKGGRSPSCDANGQMFLDDSDEQRNRNFEAQINTRIM